MSYPLVPLADVLEASRDPVPVDPLETYRTAGILSFGKGLFERPTVSGSETQYKTYYRLHKDQFVYSRLFAWEGALAVVGDAFDGLFVSQEFPTFDIDPNRAHPEYIAALCRWPRFHASVAGGRKGLGLRRQRVHPDQLLQVQIPLPTFDEQCRVASLFKTLFSRLAEAGTAATTTQAGLRFTSDAAIQAYLDAGVAQGWSQRPMREVATVNPPPDPLSADELITFVPMRAVEESTGSISDPEVLLRSELASSYKQFRRGDVIFARITPSMQNGKSAVAAGISTEHAYGSTEFHIIRPGDGVTNEWIHRIVRTQLFRTRAAERFTGTAGQQRVPADFLREAEIPVPHVSTQAEAITHIDRLTSIAREVDRLQRQRSRLLKVLEVSLLNHAFAGKL